MREPRDGAPPPGASTTTGAAEVAAPTERQATDVVFVHGATQDGVQITRLRDDRIESGELRPLQEGKPIVGEVVRLSARKESDRVFDVEVVARATPHALPTSAPAHKGPTRVSNERFRQNWDTVFGASPSKRKRDLPS